MDIATGYNEMVQESLRSLKDLDISEVYIDAVQVAVGCSHDTAVEAIEELKQSFETRLKPSEESDTTTSRPGITKGLEAAPGGYYVDPAVSEDKKILLVNVRVLGCHITQQGAARTSNRGEKTRVKDFIRERLPVGQYRAKFVIEEGKVDDVVLDAVPLRI